MQKQKLNVPSSVPLADAEQLDVPYRSQGDDSTFVNIRNYIGAKDLLGRPVFAPVRIDGFLFPNEPTIFVRNSKEIVRTTLVGQNLNRGTVKELIATGDYEVTIRGIAVGNGGYPEDIINSLNQLYNKNEALDIESGLCALLGIYRVVIESLDLPHTSSEHCQAYELVCHSDVDFSLYLED